MKHFLLAVLSLFLYSESEAFVVKGVVSDVKNRPLYQVNVYIPGTSIGAITNDKGEYSISVPTVECDIQFSLLGYKSKLVHVNSNLEKRVELNILLEENTSELNAITISADRKAFIKRLVQGASNYRSDWEKKTETYNCKVYSRSTLEVTRMIRDTTDSINKTWKELKSIETLLESVAQIHHTKNNIQAHVEAYEDHVVDQDKLGVSVGMNIEYGEQGIMSQFAGWDDPYLLNSPLYFTDYNLFDNNLSKKELADKMIVSPLSPTAFLNYKYELVGIDSLYNRKFYKIKCTPLFKEEPTLNGTLWIQDTTFVIGKIELSMNNSVMHTFKDFLWKESFMPIQDTWVTSSKELTTLATEGRSQYLGKIKVAYSNYDFEQTVRFNLAKNEIQSYAQDALDRDSCYWINEQVVPLELIEKKHILMQDSLQFEMDQPNYYDKIDSAYNKITFWDVTLSGIGIRNREKGTAYYIAPIIGQLNFFGIGGYRHNLSGAFSKEFENDFYLETDGMIDYGFNNKDVRGKVGVGLTYLPRKFVRTFIRFGDYYDLLNDYASLTTFFSRSNYVRNQQLSVAQRMEIVNGMYAELTVDYCDQKPINNLIQDNWSGQVFGDVNSPISFTRYRKFEVRLDMQIRLGQSYYYKRNKKIVTGFKYPEIFFKYRKGIPNILNSEVNFDYVELGARDEFDVPRIGEGAWSILGGAFVNKASLRIAEYKYFRGSDYFFFSNPLSSFQLMGPTFLTPNSYFRGNYIHHFKGMFLNKIPLVNKLRLEEAAGGAFIMIPSENFYHQEIYVGLERAVRIKRQLFKFGLYAVTADSNIDAANYTLKFGISFWNTYTKKWSY